MKTALYVIFLLAELFFAFISTLLLISWEQWGVLASCLTLFAIVLTLVVKRYKRMKKEASLKGLKWTKVWLALTLLIPTVPVIVVLVAVMIALGI